jgi:phage shock protein A
MEKKAESKRVLELLQNFNELKDKLNYLRAEWAEAHARHDLNRETELINRETELFGQVYDVVAEFSTLMRTMGVI